EGANVLGQFLGRLLEGQKHTRFSELGGPAHEEFDGEQGLAAAGTAADECRPTARQAAARDFVQPVNARSGLGKGTTLHVPIEGGSIQHWLWWGGCEPSAPCRVPTGNRSANPPRCGLADRPQTSARPWRSSLLGRK